MRPIPNGAQGQYELRVESAHLANRFKDSILPPVFSTPYLILIMENAALNAIRQYLEAGESAVGTHVDVRHLVATPVGHEVVGHAEVTLNRTHARNFPHTICQVVHESRWDPNRRRFVADFSWTERGALFPEDAAAWRQAVTVAEGAYQELHAPVVPGALYYHATNVQPGWAKTRKVIGTVGNHVFYR